MLNGKDNVLPSKVMEDEATQRWFALYVRTKFEVVVGRHLSDKGYEAYVPSQSVQRQWADRVKTVEVPLFPNYVFARFNADRRLMILTTPQVYSIVGTGKSPNAIPDEEMAAIRQIVEKGTSVRPVDGVQAGQLVEVISGPLKGLTGTVVKVKNVHNLVVRVTMLQRGVSAEISRVDIRPIQGAPPSRLLVHEEADQSSCRRRFIYNAS